MTPAVIVVHDLSAGRRVRITRYALGWRQCDLASRAGVSPVDVSHIEQDRPIKRWKRHAIARALGLDLAEVYP